MIQTIILNYLLHFLLLTASKSLELGSNLIINSDFSNPNVSSNGKYYYQSSFSIYGWNCTKICQVMDIKLACVQFDQSYCSITSVNQMIDLSSHTNQTVSQYFNVIHSSTYILSFEWLPPIINQLANKSVIISINQTPVDTIFINSSNYQIIDLNYYSIKINLTQGINQLDFIMYGKDSGGILITNVSIQEIITQNYKDTFSIQSAQTVLKYIINNTFISILNKIPGSRIFLKFIVDFNINFDRLHLYYYHKQNLTKYASIFLQAIFYFKSEQGDLIQYLFQEQNQNIVADKQALLQAILNFKQNYTNPAISMKNPSGDSFYLNEINYFYYQLPFIIICMLFLWVIFKLTSKFHFSIFFRKYCFAGTLLIIIFQGGLQDYIFYILRQWEYFFSINFIHKISNIIIIIFGFIAIFFAFGCQILFLKWYGYRARFMTEGFHSGLGAACAVILQSGAGPFCSACAHALLLENLLIQTGVLVGIELFWILFRIILLYKNIVNERIRFCIRIGNNILRIVFLITLYKFETQGSYQLMNYLHLLLMILFLLMWILDIILGVMNCLRSLLSGCFKKSVKPINNKQNELSLFQKNIANNLINKIFYQQKKQIQSKRETIGLKKKNKKQSIKKQRKIKFRLFEKRYYLQY